MNKEMTEQVMEAFAACLRHLYAAAGLEMPVKFNPEKEAVRLETALRAKK